METNILILAYDRPDSLHALVRSIKAAELLGPVHLWISCDQGASEDVVDYARNLDWDAGSYQFLQQESHLGPDEHNLFALQMAADMGHMLVLEDDLIVSPYLFHYLQACRELKKDKRLAGISIYRYAFREVNHLPFELLPNDESVYYQQRPSSKGCFYTAKMAKRFLEYRIGRTLAFQDYHLPANVLRWGDEVWEKFFYCYLLDTGRYVAFPRFSLSTDEGEVGVHMREPIHRYIHQVPLYLSNTFHVKPFDETDNRYDAFYELLPVVLKQWRSELEGYDLEVDLYGTKDLSKVRTTHLISVRYCRYAQARWGRTWKPEVHNVLFNRPGDTYALAPLRAFDHRPYTGSSVADFYYYYPDTALRKLLWLKCKEVWSRWF